MEISSDNKTEFPIYKGPLFKCSFCQTFFISTQFLEKHIKKCEDSTISTLIEFKLENLFNKEKGSILKRKKQKKQNASNGNFSEMNWTTNNKEKQRTTDYYCQVCFRGFLNGSTYRKHMISHSDERPYPCSECNKKYKIKRDLNRHILLVHRKVKKFKCAICTKTFGMKHYLIDHVKIHSAEKPFDCKYCPSKFKLKCHLKEHMNLHTEQTFSCSYCSWDFKRKSYLNRHINSIHKTIL